MRVLQEDVGGAGSRLGLLVSELRRIDHEVCATRYDSKP